MVTPVDFHAGQSVISRWAGRGGETGEPSGVNVDRAVDALGIIPGDVLNIGFLMREPFGLNLGKYLGLLDLFDNEYKLHNFLRVEKWSFDSPDQAGEAFRQFIKDCYQQNKLIKGEMEIGGQRVDLRRVTMPVLNLHAQYDDLVPPESVEALGVSGGYRGLYDSLFPGRTYRHVHQRQGAGDAAAHDRGLAQGARRVEMR